jgi:hypothetical protein
LTDEEIQRLADMHHARGDKKAEGGHPRVLQIGHDGRSQSTAMC